MFRKWCPMKISPAEPLQMEWIDQQEWELAKLLRKLHWIGTEQEAGLVSLGAALLRQGMPGRR